MRVRDRIAYVNKGGVMKNLLEPATPNANKPSDKSKAGEIYALLAIVELLEACEEGTITFDYER